MSGGGQLRPIRKKLAALPALSPAPLPPADEDELIDLLARLVVEDCERFPDIPSVTVVPPRGSAA